jgi:hypothetical protein
MPIHVLRNRRAWLVGTVATIVVLLVALSARAETVVFDNAAFVDGRGATSDRDPLNPSGIALRVCDNFVVGSEARRVTAVEWVGLYGTMGETTASDPMSPSDDFTILFYDDADGVPGRVIAEYRPGEVTRVATAGGAWSYRYTLPGPLAFEPGRPYHVAICNNLAGAAYWCWGAADRGSNHSAEGASAEWVRWPGDCAFRLTFTEPPEAPTGNLPWIVVALVGVLAFRLHRYVF